VTLTVFRSDIIPRGGPGGMRVVVVGGAVGVHGGGGRPVYGVDQGVLGCHGQGVLLHHGGLGVDDDVGLGAQGVADPPHADLPHVADAVHGALRVTTRRNLAWTMTLLGVP
jgi:hypothetical protein